MQTLPPNQNEIARGGGITRPPDHEHFAWSVGTLVAAAVLSAVAALSTASYVESPGGEVKRVRGKRLMS